MKLLAAAASAALVAVAPAVGATVLDPAVASLRGDPVYVSPEAQLISDEDAVELRKQIGRDANGPVFIALLPASAKDEVNGSATEVALWLGRQVGTPGVYAVVVGNEFRAVSTDLGTGRAGALATEAFEANRDDVFGVLSDFVRRVGEARLGSGAGAAAAGDRDGSRFWLVGLAVGGAALLTVLFVRRRRRARELGEVKTLAREDLVALADDVTGLDAEVEDNPKAKDAYTRALDEYQRADDAFDRARSPRDLAAVTSALSQSRYEMETAKALLAGEDAPEQRPPCFFDPRHGTSKRDVWWSPPYGDRQLVPACEPDALKVEAGEEPDTRKVRVNGSERPYWDAPSYFGPWAGGFYGSGILPGLLVGSVLGSTWGGASDATAAPGADLNSGGWDGFGGGDFGGGDFGGGDFGGGGDF
jgi:hypothetical protein